MKVDNTMLIQGILDKVFNCLEFNDDLGRFTDNGDFVLSISPLQYEALKGILGK